MTQNLVDVSHICIFRRSMSAIKSYQIIKVCCKFFTYRGIGSSISDDFMICQWFLLENFSCIIFDDIFRRDEKKKTVRSIFFLVLYFHENIFIKSNQTFISRLRKFCFFFLRKLFGENIDILLQIKCNKFSHFFKKNVLLHLKISQFFFFWWIKVNHSNVLKNRGR